MPLVLYVLALAVFAQATSEFMLAGLVPEIATDLGVPLAAAGALTSAFAAGMVVGAPLMALAARRVPPRAALAVLLAAFVAVHVAGALTPGFAVLLATRVLAALANAGFLAVALAVAVRLAPPGRTARATSILLAGTTLACIAGVPAGAALGQWLGWRAAFWAVALICLPALVGVLRGVPGGRPAMSPVGPDASDASVGSVGSVADELRVLCRLPLLATLLVAALLNAATFGAYTYLAPLLTDATGLAPGLVPVGLALFGVGSFVGVTVAGRLGDTRPGIVLAGGGVALALGWAGLALGAGAPVLVLAMLLVLGALAFGVGSTLIARVLLRSADAPTLGGSYATVAFNVGAVLGPLLAGSALDASGSARGPVWVAAALTVAAGLVGAAAALSKLGRLSSRTAARAAARR